MTNHKAIAEVLKIMSLSEADQKKYFGSLPPDKTSTLLVEDLEQKSPSENRDKMIARAKSFGYDDFRFTMLYDDCVCPKLKLEEDATKAGFHDIAYNNRQGRYD